MARQCHGAFVLFYRRYFRLTPTKGRVPNRRSVADKDALKPQLVPAMIALSGASDKAIRAQIAEPVSLIAELDFPERWPDLIDVRQRANLSNLTHVLLATRTISQQQRHEHQPRRTRDRTLYLPRVAVARARTRSGRSSSSSTANSSCRVSAFRDVYQAPPRDARTPPCADYAVLIDIYYDLTSQDLAPEFDDRHETFFAEGTGYFMQLMA